MAPVIFLDSTKEQDGLIGPVRRVQTETAKLETNAGLSVKHRASYSGNHLQSQGRAVDNTYASGCRPSGTEEYKYDDNGHIVEMTLKARDGSIIMQGSLYL